MSLMTLTKVLVAGKTNNFISYITSLLVIFVKTKYLISTRVPLSVLRIPMSTHLSEFEKYG